MRLHLPAIAGVTLAFTAAAPAAAAPESIYGGHTAQDAPIALRVAGSGRALRQLLVHVSTTCEDGNNASWSGAARFAAFAPPTVEVGDNVFSPARLSRRGAFRATGVATDAYGDMIGKVAETIRGTVRRGVAHGTFSATIDILDPATGAKVTSCRSGTLRWAARSAPGRVYAGLTSDRRPIVVQRSRSGRKVSSVWVSWSAPCRNGGGFGVAEELVDFPVAGGGRFGDTFTDEVKPAEGGTRAFDYRLEGRAGAARVAGTFRVEVTDSDAAGATTDTCDTTLLSWSARSTKGGARRVSQQPGEVRRRGGA
jgi:hypothetical protein